MNEKGQRKPFRFKNKKIRGDGREVSNPDPRAVEIGRIRHAILKECENEIDQAPPKTKGQTIREFLRFYNSDLILPEIFNKPKHLSRSSLYGWVKRFREEGKKGLIPGWKYKVKVGATVVPMKFPKWENIKILGKPRTRGIKNFQFDLKQKWRRPPLTGPIRLFIFYGMPVPRETTIRRRMKILRREIPHTWKPNLDALNAFMVECLQGILFFDHSQILSFHSEKFFEWVPKTRISIQRMSAYRYPNC